MKTIKLLEKYPIRISQWHYSVVFEFVCDISDFGPGFHISDIKDPWDRKFKTVDVITDQDYDVVKWNCHTTVEGNPLKCIVFND